MREGGNGSMTTGTRETLIVKLESFQNHRNQASTFTDYKTLQLESTWSPETFKSHSEPHPLDLVQLCTSTRTTGRPSFCLSVYLGGKERKDCQAKHLHTLSLPTNPKAAVAFFGKKFLGGEQAG